MSLKADRRQLISPKYNGDTIDKHISPSRRHNIEMYAFSFVVIALTHLYTWRPLASTNTNYKIVRFGDDYFFYFFSLTSDPENFFSIAHLHAEHSLGLPSFIEIRSSGKKISRHVTYVLTNGRTDGRPINTMPLTGVYVLYP